MLPQKGKKQKEEKEKAVSLVDNLGHICRLVGENRVLVGSRLNMDKSVQ